MEANNRNLLPVLRTWKVGLIFALLLTVSAPAAELEPDNAALLYYQAFLLCPKAGDMPHELSYSVIRNPSVQDIAELRKYTRDYQHVIRLLEAASSMPRCNLGVPQSKSLRGAAGEVRLELIQQTMSAVALVTANVRVLATDGDYETAFSQSLMLRRIAWHIADDPPHGFDPLFLMTFDRAGLQCARSVLEIMPPDENTLRWLSKELAEAPQISDVMLTRIRYDLEHWLPMLRELWAANFPIVRKNLAKKSTNEAKKREALALTDDELIALIREPIEAIRRSVLDTLGSEMSYAQRHARLESLSQEYWEKQKNNPAIIPPLLALVDNMVGHYDIQVANTSDCNAYEAAVEIYLHKATTGKLPRTLPDGLPKDPYTGKDFEYKVTKEGFELTHPVKYADKGEYKFKVPLD